MQQINYGMPTLIETETLEECAKLCANLGLDFIELNMNIPAFQVDKIDVEYFKNIAEKYGIYYTIHLDENLNISDFNPYVAEAYKKTVANTIELAKQLDIKVLNMHMAKGVYFTLPDRKVYLFSEYKEYYLKSIVNFREMCENSIGNADIKICIENCDGYEDFQKEAINLLLESNVFALTFDVGHNHGIGGADEEFIIKHKDRLQHIHLHDAVGRKNHLALGTGEVNTKKYIDLAKEQNCRVVLETKTIDGLKQSIKWLKNHIKDDYRTIEPLKLEDYHKCSNIWNMKSQPLTEKWREEISSGNRLVFVYKINDEFIGEGALVLDTGDSDYTIPNQRVYVSRMIVKKEYRNQGIGSTILTFLIEKAKEIGYKEMTIGVDKDNVNALHLYRKFGFAEVLFDGSDEYGEYFKLMKII